MPTVTEAIHYFLKTQRESHNNPEMIDFISQPGMEIQVNVSSEGGRAVDGMRNTYERDGYDYKWHNIRIPKHANTEPQFKDYESN
ncbi:MAG: hypothetical protein KDA84_30610, partial [Planctomycetaceae bacterium]|nr:hypothetical protein [Planctomycetaceae bacterium]